MPTGASPSDVRLVPNQSENGKYNLISVEIPTARADNLAMVEFLSFLLDGNFSREAGVSRHQGGGGPETSRTSQHSIVLKSLMGAPLFRDTPVSRIGDVFFFPV